MSTRDNQRRIGFGLDRDGFFAVLFQGHDAVLRLRSHRACDDAMRWGIAWGEKEQVPVDVVRVDTRLLR